MSLTTAALTRAARVVAATALTVLPVTATIFGADLSPAHAATTCMSALLDRADVIDDNWVDTIPGARIFVLSFSSVPNGDIDAAVLDQRANCSDMQNPNGGWASDVIVIAFSIKEQTSSLFYGARFENALGENRWNSARLAMSAGFSDGDFTGGVNTGIARVKDLIANPNAAPTTNTSTNTGSEPSEPLDVPWAWILGVPAGAAVLAGGGFGGMRLRRRLIERNRVRSQALALTNKAADQFVELEPLDELTTARVADLPQTEDDGILAIRDLSQKTTAKTSTVVSAYLAHMEQWPERTINKSTLLVAQQALASAQQVTDGLTQALTSNQTLEQALNDLETRNAQTPLVLDNAAEKATATLNLLNTLSDEGYAVTEYRASLNAAVAAMPDVRTQHTQNLWGEAASAAADIAARIDGVHEEVTDLRARRARIEDKVTVLAERHEDLTAARSAGEGDLARLVGAFHSSCVNGITEQFDNGDTSHADAARDIEQALVAVGMDQQRFDDAEQALALAQSRLDHAEEAFTAPARQHQRLTDLAEDLSARVATVQSEIADVASKMTHNREAMKFLDRKPDLDVLRRRVETVAGELNTARPAFLSLRTDLDAVRGEVSAAEREVSGIIRDYQQAQQAIARAERAVRDAKSQSTRSHAGSRSKSLAADAERNLRDASNAVSLALIISNANSAVSSASAAESAARSAISSYNSHTSHNSYSSGGSGAWSGGGGGSGSWGGGGGSGSSDGGGGSGGW